MNDELFPFKDVYGPDDFDFLRSISNKIYRRFTGRSGLHFDHLIDSLKPQLFHAHMGYEGARWLSCVERNGLPLITTFYGADVSKLGRIPRWRRRYKQLFEYGVRFLAEGPYLKQQLLDLGCPMEKITVQHLGIPVSQYPFKNYKNPRERSKIVVLQVSTFREKKGIRYSLEAIARVRTLVPNIEFRLIGKGDNSSADRDVGSMIDRLHLRGAVRLLGARPHAETILEMLDADLFLHPSVTAADGDNEGGAPVSIIEASAVGLPVISTVHADIPEVVRDRETGLLAPERSVDGIVDHLTFLMNHRNTWEPMGIAGRAHVSRRYNSEFQIPALENIYFSVLQN